MLAAMLTACAEKHSHENDLWTATVEGHYQICRSSAKKINEGKHELDYYNVCKKCGAKFDADTPIELEFTTYNKFGLRDCYVEYVNGKETYRRVYEYVYKNGKPVSYTAYVGTDIYEEGIVAKIDGEYERLVTKYYYGDGVYEIRTYDEDGYILSMTDYDEEGKVLFERKYTYEKDSKGNIISRTTYDSENKIMFEKCALDENGEYYYSEEIGYDSEGEVRYVSKYDSDNIMLEYLVYENGEVTHTEKYEYVFDENGETLSRKAFVNGVLYTEWAYKYVSYQYASPKTQIHEYTHYSFDGGKYIDVYDEYGRIVLTKDVDSEGNTVSETETEYTIDNLGRVTLEKEIENGVLSREYAYEYEGDSDDWEKRTETRYYDDGGKEITVYNDNYDEISRIEYDSVGEVVRNETYEYEYDESGNVINEKTFEGGELVEEVKYTYDEDGNLTYEERYEHGALAETWTYLPYPQGGTYVSNNTTYYSHGGKLVVNYDENGHITLDVEYDADGNYVYYYKYVNVKNDDGTETNYTYDENDKLLYESLRNEDGMTIKQTEYYSDGRKRVMNYNENGIHVHSCYYDKDGKLTLEYVYADDDGRLISETQYHAEGKTVYVHNADGTVTCNVYDTDGKLISSETI